MIYSLQSDELIVLIGSKGAELQSIKNRAGFEYLYQANPSVWPRQAPVLFPIVGKLKNNQYTFQEKTYKLPQHGFARDLEFVPILEKENEAWFECRSSEKTKEEYPFDFCLQLGYSLQKNTIRCSYAVQNCGLHPMLFSIGAHPGFSIRAEDANSSVFPYLEFELSELCQNKLRNGLISNENTPFVIQNKQLKIVPELFLNDALVFCDNQIKRLILYVNPEGRKVTLNCANWPFFGIWSKPHPVTGALNFVCLEPWQGIADVEKHDGKLENKRGIIYLEADKSFKAHFELEFY